MKTKRVIMRILAALIISLPVNLVSCTTDLGCLQCYDTNRELWSHEHCYHSYEVRELIIADHYSCYEN